MTPVELSTLATQLFGTRWQSALARAIARERRTVNRWATGDSPIPKAVQAWLLKEVSQPTESATDAEKPHQGRQETHPAQGAKAGAGRRGRRRAEVMPQSCPMNAFHEETDPTEGL